MKVILSSFNKTNTTSSSLVDLIKSMEKAEDEDKSQKGDGAGNVSTTQFTES